MGRPPAHNGGLARPAAHGGLRAAAGLSSDAAGNPGGCRENVSGAAQSGRTTADDGPTCPRWSCGLAQHLLRERWPTSFP